MLQHTLRLSIFLLLASCGKDSDTDTDDGGNTSACPTDACEAGRECLELTDPGDASAFTLRIAQVTIAKPSTLGVGILGSVFTGAALPSLPSCDVDGSGTWNTLLGFDTSADSLTIASAKAAYPYEGAEPATTTANLGSDGAFAADPVDVNLGVYLDEAGDYVVVLPVRRATFSGTLSDSHACIGAYDGAGLEATQCVPDGSTPIFREAGSLVGHITLEAADAVMIDTLQESLCVALSGDPATYGDGGMPAKCKRDFEGRIELEGDWCSATDRAADASCADAMRVDIGFAASAVNASL